MDTPPPPTTVRLGRYEVVGRIAAGGTATVYAGRLAAEGGFARDVALKVVHPHLIEDAGFRERFLAEARLASRLQHPHVVSTFDVGEDHGHHFMVLERIDGVTLRQIQVHVAPRFTPEVAARMVADAARGLHALHELRDADGRPLAAVHRDLSPHNLMADRSGRTVLIDLGLAKARDQVGFTQTGVLCGKLPYMSPEQVELHPLDRRSDIFALGSVLFELVTGELPFGDDHATSTLVRLRACDPSAIADKLAGAAVPVWLAEIVSRCLRKRPEQRFADAAELADALEAGNADGSERETRRTLVELVERTAAALPPWRAPEPWPSRILTADSSSPLGADIADAAETAPDSASDRGAGGSARARAIAEASTAGRNDRGGLVAALAWLATGAALVFAALWWFSEPAARSSGAAPQAPRDAPAPATGSTDAPSTTPRTSPPQRPPAANAARGAQASTAPTSTADPQASAEPAPDTAPTAAAGSGDAPATATAAGATTGEAPRPRPRPRPKPAASEGLRPNPYD